jgi:hypothetical protein
MSEQRDGGRSSSMVVGFAVGCELDVGGCGEGGFARWVVRMQVLFPTRTT